MGTRKRVAGRPKRDAPDAFAALGHPKRRRIIELVAVAGSLTVGGIASEFGESRQAISKHIAVLEEAHVLTSQQRGRERHYAVDLTPLLAVYDWLGFFDGFWEGKLAGLQRILE